MLHNNHTREFDIFIGKNFFLLNKEKQHKMFIFFQLTDKTITHWWTYAPSNHIFLFFLTTIIFYSNACYNKLLMKQYIYNINIETFVTQLY